MISELEIVQNLNDLLFCTIMILCLFSGFNKILDNRCSYIWPLFSSCFGKSSILTGLSISNVLSPEVKDQTSHSVSVLCLRTQSMGSMGMREGSCEASHSTLCNLFTRKLNNPLSHFQYLFLQACGINDPLSFETNKRK